MMTFITIAVIWALGSALFIMALAAATKGKVASSNDLGDNRPLESAESLLERLQVLNGAQYNFSQQTRPVATQAH